MWRNVLPISALILLLSTGQSHACGCCLPDGAWEETPMPVAELLGDSEIGLAIETASYGGSVVAGYHPMSEDRYDSVSLSFDGKQMTVTGEEYGTIAVINIDPTMEMFLSDQTGGGDKVYREWRFKGKVAVQSPDWQEFLGPTATIIFQGHYNGCFDPRGMVRWIIKFAPTEAYPYNTATGRIEMDFDRWDAAYRAKSEGERRE